MKFPSVIQVYDNAGKFIKQAVIFNQKEFEQLKLRFPAHRYEEYRYKKRRFHFISISIGILLVIASLLLFL